MLRSLPAIYRRASKFLPSSRREPRTESAAINDNEREVHLGVIERPAGYLYRVPSDLRRTDSPPRRILVIGSCLIGSLTGVIRGAVPDCEVDYILFNNILELPQHPPEAIEAYDFQIVQIAMRTILPEGAYFRLPYEDSDAYERLFQDTKERLILALDAARRYSREAGLLTFISNFHVPQSNPLGRMLPRYDLRNYVYFFEQLNRALDCEVRTLPACYVLDIDQIAASFGKKYIQDDAVWQINHATMLSDFDFEYDQGRLEPVTRASELYQTCIYDYVRAIWSEIHAMYRTVRKIDSVKVVVVDLDDTLWRGVLAEEGRRSIEGWPMGIAEALLFLKKRGVILAIASKNDPDLIGKKFDTIFGANCLRLEDFAAHSISWRPKTESIAEIIRKLNVLPNSVVFVDDNPVERAAIQQAYPELRVVHSDLYSLRRILLWAPETQVAQITKESSKRTEMIAAQINREAERSRMSHEEFLESLGVQVSFFKIADLTDANLPRAMELVNKSNQFNTTGKRWTYQEWANALAGGMQVFAFEVEDRFTSYGLVAVALVQGDMVAQFAMSCRVVGMGIEETALSTINHRLNETGTTSVRAQYIATEANYLCKDILERIGFCSNGDVWAKPAMPCIPVPPHICIAVGP
jgi:FkbH-like protein